MSLIEYLHLSTIKENAPVNALCFTRKNTHLINATTLELFALENNFTIKNYRELEETARYLKEWCSSLKYSRCMYVWLNNKDF